MCGIVGKLAFDRQTPVDAPLLLRMAEQIRHRGPDDGGVWTDGGIGLGCRRLAILDLSERGHQPMANDDGSIHIAYNGEIYNFQEIRRYLERKGHRFRSTTDTETLLRLYEEEGVDCLGRLRGMFAFAIWDAPRGRLLLARDRLGKKPLVYYQDANQLVFASEAKALLQDPVVPRKPNHEAIHHFLTYGYVPAPLCAFEGWRKLPPGHYLIAQRGQVSLHQYWTLRYLPKRRGTVDALGEELEALLQESVSLRMISDVPLGALLSGGLDSSVIVALMRRLTSGPVRTFSIGSDRSDYDERRYARMVAERFETEHHELVVRPDATSMLPRLAWHYDEPFADSSAVPSFAVSALARSSVTVALNGDGGDECFLGYQRYLAVALAARLDLVPRAIRQLLGRLSVHLPKGGPRSSSARLGRLAAALLLEPRLRYMRWLTFDDGWKDGLYTPAFAAATEGHDSFALLNEAYERSDAPTVQEQSAHVDLQLYLPDDLLVKMDIASMAHSLEVRSPFLDHKVVEFAASLPAGMKQHGVVQKYLLKRIMKGILPKPVLRRRKAGFAIPIDHWFRHELREMAYDVLLSDRARARGYFRPEVVRRYLDDHAARRGDHHDRLWSLLMLELWHRTFIDGDPAIVAPRS
ncbi:MAG: asparagine synthase (glutamine-hydrolyzing) [Vicinamibacterales bacterium]